ncbi:MAG: rhodanese-like domain-containing protein [Bacteroidota bacterium]
MRKIKKLFVLLALSLGLVVGAAAQTSEAYKKKLSTLYKGTVPVMQPADLDAALDQGEPIILLDTRAPREYEVSHLPGATFVDYDHFNKKAVKDLDRNARVVVYCTVGYRSERIGEQLKKLGFTDVHNLYGGIFEWKNQGHDVVDEAGNATEAVHTYSKQWSKWLQTGKKVYQ